MPRPKRTKLTSARNAQQPPHPAPVVTRKPPKPAHIDHTEISDDSDGLVFKSTRVRRKRMPWDPEPQKDDVDLTMTGGLPVESDTEPHISAPRSRSPSARASSNHGVVSPKATQLDARRTPKSQLRPTSPQTRQPSAPPEDSLGARNNYEYTENYSFTSINSKSSPAGQVHPSSAVRKMHATPAMETSILALANFKRRQRQPSILRMVHQTTDVEDNDLDDLDDLTGLGDLDDFNPDDESTPLQLHRQLEKEKDKSRLSTSSSSTSSVSWRRKLKSPVRDVTGVDDMNEFNPDDESTPLQLHRQLEQEKAGSRLPASSSSASSGSRKRKMKSPDVQVPRSSPPYDPPSGSDLEASGASSPLPGDIIESREEPPVAEDHAEPDLQSETMAPPRSSSPVSLADESTSIRTTQRQTRQTQRNKKGIRAEAVADAAPAVEKKRPIRAKPKTKPKASDLYTAKLQSLLPKRKTRSRTTEPDVFDILASDEVSETPIDSDQDELQRPPSRRAPAAAKRAPAKAKAKKKKAPPKQKKPEPVVPSRPAPQGSRTYGRPSSDKENESTFVYDEEPEDGTEAMPTIKPASSATLAAIAKKFEEVDQWEMEFESVDVGEGESSPWR